MTKIARGTMVFEYQYEEGKSIREYIEEMVEDIIDMAYSDLSPAIEMEIVDV